MIHRRPWNSFLSVMRYGGKPEPKIEPTASAESRGVTVAVAVAARPATTGAPTAVVTSPEEPGGKRSAAIAGEGQLGASV
jgi:hypothetical protein